MVVRRLPTKGFNMIPIMCSGSADILKTRALIQPSALFVSVRTLEVLTCQMGIEAGSTTSPPRSRASGIVFTVVAFVEDTMYP